MSKRDFMDLSRPKNGRGGLDFSVPSTAFGRGGMQGGMGMGRGAGRGGNGGGRGTGPPGALSGSSQYVTGNGGWNGYGGSQPSAAGQTGSGGWQPQDHAQGMNQQQQMPLPNHPPPAQTALASGYLRSDHPANPVAFRPDEANTGSNSSNPTKAIMEVLTQSLKAHGE
eukprot:1334438-Rhodomonas_salina.1